MLKKLLSILALCAVSVFVAADETLSPGATLWENAMTATAEKRPKDAIAALEKIAEQAATEKLWIEYAFAVAMKAELLSDISNAEGYFARIASEAESLRTAVESAPSDLARIFLEIRLAHVYADLSQSRHDRLVGNDDAEPAAELPAKIAEWSTRQIRNEAIRCYENVLAQDALLKAIPSTAIPSVTLFDEATEARIRKTLGTDDIIEEDDFSFRVLKPYSFGDATPAEYPTLYDIVARNAQSFFTELFSPGAEEFPINLYPPEPIPVNLYPPATIFVEQDFGDIDAYKTPIMRALEIAQERARFHLNDAEKSALARATLERLLWVNQNAPIEGGGSKNDANYEGALTQFISDYEYFPITAEAAAHLSDLYVRMGQEIKAHHVAEQAVLKYDRTKNANACKNRIAVLKQKDIRAFRLPQNWTASAPVHLKISAKNTTRIRFRAIPADWRNHLKKEFNRPNNLSVKEINALLKSKNIVDWEIPLDQCYYIRDFRYQDYAVEIPAGKLPPGFYFIFVSADSEPFYEKGLKENKPVPVWVSDIAVIHDDQPADSSGNLRVRVVNSVTGDPIEGATVFGWNKARWGGERISVPEVRTDALGEAVLPGLKKDRDPIVLVEYAMPADGSDASAQTITHAASLERIHFKYEKKVGKIKSLPCPIFTDRKIYRPGQKVSFKGVLLDATNAPEKPEVFPGKKVVVTLKRGNDEVAQTEAWSNGFGSFAGTLDIPQHLGLGSYSLSAVCEEDSCRFTGTVRLNIEEYRRPKSELSIKTANTPQILGGNVSAILSGKSLTGAPLNGAKVRWEIRSNNPKRWGRRRVIAQGEGELNQDGILKISWRTLRAKLDENTEKELSPAERYAESLTLISAFEIKAELTDTNGETIEAEAELYVSNSSCSLQVSPQTPHDTVAFTDAEIPIHCSAIPNEWDGQPTAIPVTIEVFRLRQPKNVRETYEDSFEPKDEEKVFSVQTKTCPDAKGEPVAVIPAGTLTPGSYRIVATGRDEFAQTIVEKTVFTVTDRNSTTFPSKLGALLDGKTAPLYFSHQRDFSSDANPVVVGNTEEFLWGSGFDRTRAFVEFFENDKRLNAFYTEPNATQQIFRVPVTESMSGKLLTARVTVFADGEFVSSRIPVYVNPQTDLKIEKERIRTTLLPGAAELWTLKISRADGTPATETEVAATLYDISAELLLPYRLPWIAGYPHAFNPRQSHPPHVNANVTMAHWLSRIIIGRKYDILREFRLPIWSFGSLRYENHAPWGCDFGEDWMVDTESARSGLATGAGASVKNSEIGYFYAPQPTPAAMSEEGVPEEESEKAEGGRESSSAPISTRKNLTETAFFYPFLQTDDNGILTLQFIVPEALTRWRLRLFAHDKKLRHGMLELDDIVTAKDLMVQPDAPRFLREGDRIKFPVKLTNRSENTLSGEAEIRLEFFGADGKKIDASEKSPEKQRFEISAKSSTTIFREIDVPAGAVTMTYRATGKSGDVTDGEESALPVLSCEVVLTESRTALVRPGETATLAFENLGAKNTRTLAFILDTPTNAYDNVLLALPRLEKQACDTKSSDSIFHRFYANTLAKQFCDENPEIRKTIDAWTRSSPEKFNSPLAKTAGTSPYFGVAQRETEQRRGIADFFDAGKIEVEQRNALDELKKRLKANNGKGWSWLPDSRYGANPSITREILIGLARLKARDCDGFSEIDFVGLTQHPVREQDLWLKKEFDRTNENGDRDPALFNAEIAHYLYMRSFFIDEANVPAVAKAAWDHYLSEAKKSANWTTLSRMRQAQVALALWRTGEKDVPAKIVESLRQRSVSSNELGMFWSDLTTLPLWMPQYAPIETQATMIELFAEVAQDTESVEEMRLWLLTNKQTHAWESSRASAEAVFALLNAPGNLSATGRAPAKVFETAKVEIVGTDGS